MLTYFRGDERPVWQATITENSASPDLSSGHTFEVKLATVATPGTAVLTKTTGITGSSAGVVMVTWAANELDLTPGRYTAQLKITRTADNHELTVQEPLTIAARL